MDPAERLTSREAYERAEQHEREARIARGQAGAFQVKAAIHYRWAQRWRDWADDDYGDVPYPLDR